MSNNRPRPTVPISLSVAMLAARRVPVGVPFFHRPTFTRVTYLGLVAKANQRREAERLALVEKRQEALQEAAA